MELAHNAKRNLLPQVRNIHIRIFGRGPVVEHQQDSGKGKDEEKEKGEASHTPGVAHLDGMLGYGYRMQVQDDVVKHRHHSVTSVAGNAGPENRTVNLAVTKPVEEVF